MGNSIGQPIVGSRRGSGRRDCCNYTSVDNNSTNFVSDTGYVMICVHISQSNQCNMEEVQKVGMVSCGARLGEGTAGNR